VFESEAEFKTKMFQAVLLLNEKVPEKMFDKLGSAVLAVLPPSFLGKINPIPAKPRTTRPVQVSTVLNNSDFESSAACYMIQFLILGFREIPSGL